MPTEGRRYSGSTATAAGDVFIHDNAYGGIVTALNPVSAFRTAFDHVKQTGTYRLVWDCLVAAVSGSPTTVTFKTHSTYALVAINRITKAKRTIIAANTTVGQFNKGSAFVAGDVFTVESADLSLNENEYLAGDFANIMFQHQINTGSSLSTNINGCWLRKQ